MKKPMLYSDPKRIYREMLSDIRKAKESIRLETYIYDNDMIGHIFLEELTKKAREGVKVYLLIDSWGSSVKKHFFHELVDFGGKVKFFREFKYVFRMFRKNHERNHRKLLIIDKKVSYVGSINITESCLSWRELVIKFRDGETKALLSSFRRSWKIHNKWKHKQIKTLIHEQYKFIHDTPIHKRKKTHSSYVKLIDNAQKSISIETPYFVPTQRILRAFKRAIKRGVKITLVLPEISDITVTDILRELYLGPLHKMGVSIFYYKPSILHSKLLIIDNETFLLGSSNVDYRSFVHQFELNVMGKDEVIIEKLLRHNARTLKKCKPFNYERWKRRGFFKRILERILWWFEHYL